VSESIPNLIEFISLFEPKQIYNSEETGFFRALPTKSLAVKGEKCTGGKMSKDYSVIVWEYGGRNGKASKPRCFILEKQ
jgi:hypothetical protein